MSDAFKLVKLSQASDVAKTISNKTAQNIIEHIGSKKKATASQIASSLDLPASTVHYNIKALVKGGIVDDSEFTYSEKGKTIIHYTLTNNIIVIVPESRDEFSVLNSIKALVPSFIGVGILGLGYALFTTATKTTTSALPLARSFDANIATSTSYAADELVQEALPFAAKIAPESTVQTTSSVFHIPEFFLGLLLATLTITAIFLVMKYLRSKKNNKQDK